MEDYLEFKFDSQVLLDNGDMLKNVGFSDCPVGWSRLVRQLFEDIRETCKKNNSPLPKVLQAKSKFGGLQFYVEFDPIFQTSKAGIEIERLIDKATKKSLSICEITGDHGTLHSKNGWLATLCEAKAKELGYTKIKSN